MASAEVKVAQYDGKSDYKLWKMRMMALLSHHEVGAALEPEDQWTEGEKKKKTRILKEAFNLLVLGLADSVLRKVSDCTTALEILDKLDEMYANQVTTNLTYLKATLFSYKMDPHKTIDDSLDEFLKLSKMLSGTSHALDESSLVMILLNSLPESFTPVKNVFQYTGTVPTLDLLTNALRTRENELKLAKAKSATSLYAKNKANGNNKGSQKPKGKQESNQADKKTESKENKETRKCFHCGKKGHLKKNCYKWKNREKKETSVETNVAANNDVVTDFHQVLTVADTCTDNSWVMDSGCSFHMCPNKSWFTDLVTENDEKVYMGNNNMCKVIGIGSVTLKLTNGNLVTLTKVRCVPGLRRNLISLGALDDLGCKYFAENGVLSVLKNDKVVLTGSKCSGLYVLDGDVCPADNGLSATCLIAKNDSVKWHLRLGHIGNKSLEVLAKTGIFGNLKLTELPTCEHCILAKQHRLKFEHSKYKSKGILEYIHADLWGPESHETFGGNKYFLSIIDDFSRRVWVYLLKTKGEALTKFKEWVNLEENQSDKKIKTHRTDNGLEFCNL